MPIYPPPSGKSSGYFLTVRRRAARLALAVLLFAAAASSSAFAADIKLTVSPLTVGEGAGETTVAVTAAWDDIAQRSSDTDVLIQDIHGTTSAADYAAVPSFTITIPANMPSKTVTFKFTPTSDTVHEGDEYLIMFGLATGFSTSAALLTITDDDVGDIKLSLTDSTAVGEEDGLTSVEVTATWDGTPSSTATVVTVSVDNDLTSEAADFEAVTDFTITIPADTQSKTVTFKFTPTNDTLYEDEEMVKVSGKATGFTVESAYLTITDDEIAPTTINLTLTDSTVGEEDGLTSVEVTAAWEGTTPIESETRVDVSVAVGTGEGAAETGDFAAVAGFRIKIAGGSLSQTGTFDFTPTSDLVYEGDETVKVSGTATGFTVEPATLTITDNNEVAPTTINLTLSPSAVGEGAGLTSVEVTAAWAGASTRLVDTTVTVSVAAGTGQANDFTAVTDFDVIIAATTQSKEVTFSFEPTNDNVDEPNETVTVSGTATDLTVNPVDLTITDNDVAVTVSLTSLDVDEGGSATYTVVLDTQPMANVLITITQSPQDRVTVDEASLRFTPVNWATPQTVTVSAQVDSDADNDMTVLSHRIGNSDTLARVTVTVNDRVTVASLGMNNAARSAPLPAGYKTTSNSYMDVTAPVGVTLDLCLPYDGNEGPPKLFHWDGTEWGALPNQRIEGNKVCGMATDFSPFAVFYRLPPLQLVLGATDQTATEDIPFRYQMPAATDPEGDPLTYTTALTGGGNLPGWLTFDAATRTFGGLPRDTDTPATWNIEVTAADNDSPPLTGATTFTLTVENFDDSRLLEVANEWLARFGRTVTSHVMDSIGDRLADDAAHDKLTLAGESVPLGSASGTEAGSGLLADATNTDLRVFDDRFLDDGALGEWLLRDSDSRGITKRELLTGSSFHLTTTSVGDQGDGTGYDGAGRWTIWGGGLATRFEGRKSDDLPIDGEVLTGIAAFDWERDRWLAGMALSYSEGDGKFDVPAFGAVDAIQGTVESSLTAIHPYLRYRPRTGLEFWGMLGHGQGEMTLETAGDERATPDISMNMVGVGGRSALRSAQETGGPAVDMVGDVLLARTESEAAGDLKKAVSAKTTRVRLGLEGSWDWRLQDGSLLKPTLEAGLRHDGGDAENGFGLELGGGASWSDRRLGLTAELSGRMLLVHEDQDFREWGAGGSLRYDLGADGLGFTLGLSPTWGASDSGMDRLWSDRALPFGASDDLASSGHESGRLEGEVGYGLSAFGGVGRLTPYGGVELSDGNRDWRLGTRLEVGSSVDLRLEGARRERASESPEHSIGLRLRMTW